MIKERNIYTTDKFLSLLVETGHIVNCDNVNTTTKRINTLKPVLFNVPDIYSEYDEIFCDFEGYPGELIKTLHDVEYIYDISDVYYMRGKKYKPFKHNINIFSNRHNHFKFEHGPFSDIKKIHADWILPDLTYEKNKSLMMELIYSYIDKFERFDRMIFYEHDEPVGFVLYDVSPKYIHLYYTYGVPTTEYLDDFVNWIFFRYLYKIGERRQVNFGGVYGDVQIKRQKDRMCPVEVRNRWQWTNQS